MNRAVVILPTYNERENITSLIKSLQQEFKKIPHYSMDILVVDDNSPDGTQVIIRELQRHSKNLHLLTGEKQGLGKAYLRGMDYAINTLKADVIFEMDADHSHNPSRIPIMLQKLDQGYDMIIGARYIPGGSIPQNWGLHRKIFSRVGNTLVRFTLMHFDVHDWTSGFRAIRSWVFTRLHHQLTDFTGYTFQVALLHKALKQDAKILEIPIHFIDRKYGKSKIGGEYVKNLIVYLLKTFLADPPQFFKFLVVGGLGFVIQFITFRMLRNFSLRPSLATALSAEVAIASNFFWNNLWTFADRQIKSLGSLLVKFPQFNLTSLGSIAIQFLISELGTRTFGIILLLSLSGFKFFTDDVYLMIGILLGLIWNYTMYKLVIWKK